MKSVLVFDHLNDIVYLNCSVKLVKHVEQLAKAKGLVSSEYSTPYGKGENAIDPNILIQLFSPLVTSHRFMKEQFKNPYNSIQCEDGTNIVFEDYMGFIFLQIGTEDLAFLRRALGICISYVSYVCGPDVSILKSSKYHADLLDTLLATWTSLYSSDQSFLMEAVEQMHINIQVTSALTKSLTQVAAKIKSWGSPHLHALLFMETKLLSWYSTRRLYNLSAQDLMFFITLCQRNRPISTCSRNGGLDAHLQESSSSETFYGGRNIAAEEKIQYYDSENLNIEHFFILLRSGANFVPYRIHVGLVQEGLYLLFVCECPLSPVTQQISSALEFTHKIQESRRDVIKDKQYYDILESTIKKVLDSLKKQKNNALRNEVQARWERLKIGFSHYLKTRDSITLQFGPLVDILRDGFRTYFSEAEKLRGVVKLELESIWKIVQTDTSDFWSFLKVKSSRNTILGSKETISKYLEEFPGLVHFIYVDRSRHWVTMPALNFSIDDTVRLTRSHIWGMVNFAREHMQQGHFSLMWKDTTFNYAYFLWFEDPSGQAVRAKHEHGLPLETYPLPGILCGDFYKRLIAERFPGVLSSKVKCLELLCIHLGLATSSCVLEHSKRLATTIFEVTGTSNDLM